MPSRVTRIGFVSVLVVFVAACGSSSGHAPTQPDAAADVAATAQDAASDGTAALDEGTAVDGTQGDRQPMDLSMPSLDAGDTRRDQQIALTHEAGSGTGDVSLTACSSALSGMAPFGAALVGKASFVSTSASANPAFDSTRTVYLYLPGGRVAGAPAQLGIASPVVVGQYFFGPPVALADDLSATGLTVSGHDTRVVGDLLPGTGGLLATLTANFTSPGSDVADSRTATGVLLCPAGEVPAPAMEIAETAVWPIGTLSLNTTTPLSTNALAALRFSSPLGPVPIKVSPDPYAGTNYAHGPNFVISAATAFPPGQPLSVDASEVRDVLGRPVLPKLGLLSDSPVITVPGTSGLLSDLTFATAPPPEALACSGGSSVANGILTISKGGMASDVDGLLALPPLSATLLRVLISIGEPVPGWSGCVGNHRSASMEWAAMAVVGPNGETSDRISLACYNTMVDRVLDLPKASPLWLAVHVEGSMPVPYFSPPGDPPPVLIDELEPM